MRNSEFFASWLSETNGYFNASRSLYAQGCYLYAVPADMRGPWGVDDFAVDHERLGPPIAMLAHCPETMQRQLWIRPAKISPGSTVVRQLRALREMAEQNELGVRFDWRPERPVAIAAE